MDMSMKAGDINLEKLNLKIVATPIFIDYFLTFSIFFSDTFFLANVSDLVAASVGCVIPIFMIFVIMSIMLAQAGASVAGQFMGAKRMEKVVPTYMSTIVINSIFGLMAMLAFIFLGGKLKGLLGLTPESNHYVSIYFRYVAPAIFIITIKNAYNAILVSQGKTIWNMYAALLGNGLNIAANSVFMFGLFGLPRLGIYGVILATILSQLVSLLFLILVIHGKLDVNFTLKGFGSHFRNLLKPILSIGLPASVEPFSSETGSQVMACLAILLGTTAMAARTYTMNLMILGMCWTAALAIANQILVAHRVGAKNFDGADDRLKKSLIASVAGSALIAVCIYLPGSYLLGIFTDDPEIIQLGTSLLLIGLLLEPARAVEMTSGYALKGAGDAKFPATFAIFSTWFIALPAAYFIGIYLGKGLVGVWCGMLIDQILRASVNYWRWTTRKWEMKGVNVQHPEPAEEESMAVAEVS